MTSTNGSIIIPYWSLKRPRLRRVAPLLTLTNAARLALLDLEPADIVELETLAQMPRPRAHILSGPIKPSGATLLDPKGLDIAHGWPAEGRRQHYHFIWREM